MATFSLVPHVQADFKHDPLDQSIPSIRLIRLLPGLSEDGLLRCQLKHATVPPPIAYYEDREYEETTLEEDTNGIIRFTGELPTYSCLSYTWGDPDQEHAIQVNDQTFYVRKNLFEFLVMAADKLNNMFFWIDALCIDQTNTTERNHQVQQMGTIFSRAEKVVIWLGNDFELEHVLFMVNMASNERAMYAYEANLDRLVGSSRPREAPREIDIGSWVDTPIPTRPGPTVDYITQEENKFNFLTDTTGKVEKLLASVTEHEYWSRAWVTQEVLLARHTVVVAGETAHDLDSLAGKFRAAVPYFRDNAFENLVDILLQQANEHGRETGLKTWGVVNLLHRFRNKKCAIRRDRIYSLLALCKEGEKLKVDYDVPEQHLMRQVLSLRESSMCLCSAAVVSHALSPWDFTSDNEDTDNTPFVEAHMYACVLSSGVCPFCSNWVPFSWTRKKGIVFCLGTACPDTLGHLFWEQPNCMEDSKPQSQNSIYAQSRQNNKSQVLCQEGAGLEIKQSEWNHVYLLRFTFRSIVEILQEDLTSGMGLNACTNLWPNASSTGVAREARLRFCGQG